jgi:caffeoyl-CoA O-methyltransferase
MSKFITMNDSVYAYMLAHASEQPGDDVLRALADETHALGKVAQMQIAPEQGAFMTMLARLIGAKSAIEIGTFTGYSALCIARGLAPGGKLLACDVSEEWTAIGKRYWQKAGVAERIELRIGPGLETLRALPAGTTFDMAFVDADKPSYLGYYEEILTRLRPNGVILFDNVLWSGKVADASVTDESTTALRALSDRVAKDARVESVMIAVADGLTLVRKR